MYYEVYGQGFPLVLLHGFTGSSADWALFKDDLSQDHQLIIPDLRGHGRSINPEETFTFRQVALDIYSLLDQLGIEQFKAIGMSGGGKTLLHMATQQLNRLRAMVLVSATSYFPKVARVIMGQMTLESRTQQDWQTMQQRHKGGDEQIRKLWRQGHAFKDSYDDMNFTPPYLSTITARTLIIHGDRDPLYPINIPVELYTAIPNSSLWIIPNGEHIPIFGDWRAQFIQTVSLFLQDE